MNQDLVKYVKKGLSEGYSETVIKAHLLKHGYSIVDVDEAVYEATKKKKKTSLDKLNSEANSWVYYLRVLGLTALCIISFSALVLIFDTTDVVPQVILCVLMIVFGFSCAVVLHKNARNSTEFELGIYFIGAVTSVLVTSVFVFVNRMIRLYQHSGEIESKITYALHPMADPFISGIVFLLLFSLPSVAYYIKFEKKNNVVFVSYFVWVAVYLAIHKFLIPMLF